MLAASRQLSSVLAVWSVGKQLRVLSILHQCDRRSCVQTNTSQVEFVQKDSFGIRHCSHQTINTDSEDVRTIQRSSKRKPKSTSFQKLHSRVFTEEEEVDEQQFKTQDFQSGSDADMFGTLQNTEVRNVRDHSPESSLVSSSQSDRHHFSDSIAKSADGKSTNQENVAEHHALKEKNVRIWMQKVSQAKQSQSWSDEFGTLVEDSFVERIEESRSTAVGSHEERFSDDEDEQDSMRVRLSAVGRRRIPEWYGRRILKLGRKGQVREAIEVFEDWMLKQDRVKPNSYVFTCLLTVLGRAGYTKKAFSIFRKMKSMGIQPNAVTYTALFNACANCPWKTEGQGRAASVLRLMKEKDVEPTFITGKAMVKAFAMCGDLRQAFSLVDELSQVYRPDPEIFSFLLMACISDKEAGLCHAIKVWRVMRQMNVQPDRPIYNLLLRCVRDCGIGDRSAFITLLTGVSDADSTQQSNLLHSDTKEDSGKVLSFSDVKHAAEISSASVTSEQVFPEPETVTMAGEEHQPEDITEFRSQETGKPTEVISQCHVQNTHSSAALILQSSATVPDVLSPNQQDSNIVSLGDLSTKESRLLLLGGVQGILSRMAKDGASPDVITFTQLISVAMPTVEAEQQLLEVMRTMRVKPDIDLVNTLIHKRCMRADFAAARSVGEIMLEHGLTSNQMTFGVLAMTCRTQKDAAQLLDDMEAADMAPNMEILGTLMYASGMKFAYKRWVLQQVQRLNLQPNVKFLNNVENSLATVRRRMVHAEKQGPSDSYLLTPSFQHSVETFTQHYEAWLKQTQVQSSRHPWANFRSPSTDGKDAASAEA